MSIMEMAENYIHAIMNHGTVTYRNGKLDFTHAEGGNLHVHLYNPNGIEIGYIWLDTHIGSTPQKLTDEICFCGKGQSSCWGLFRMFLEKNKSEWNRDDCIFRFRVVDFVDLMDKVLEFIR